MASAVIDDCCWVGPCFRDLGVARWVDVGK